MVGDNLSNVKIYADFPDDYLNTIRPYGYSRNFINTEDSSVFYDLYYGDNNAQRPGEGRVTILLPADETNFYYAWYEDLSTYTIHVHTKPDYIQESAITTVTYIDDTNESYRHLYIEDPNIRPIQVGDKITENTKFYFNFPDDYDVENNQVDTLIKLDNDNNKRISITNVGGSSSGYTIYFRTSAAFPGVTGDNSAIFFIGSTFINKSSIVVNDIKTLTGKTGYFNGTVTYIDATHSAYQHILVDTTTLGA